MSATTPPDTIRPTKPRYTKIAPVGSRQTKLTWRAASDNVKVAGYRLYIDGRYYKTVKGYTAYITTSRGYHSFSIRSIDTSTNRSYQVGGTVRVR